MTRQVYLSTQAVRISDTRTLNMILLRLKPLFHPIKTSHIYMLITKKTSEIIAKYFQDTKCQESQAYEERQPNSFCIHHMAYIYIHDAQCNTESPLHAITTRQNVSLPE